MIKQLLQKVKSLNPVAQRILAASTIILSFALLFPAGSFSASANVEFAAEYFSDLSQNHTIDGQYSYLLIEAASENGPSLHPPYNEYYYWNNVFGKTKDVFFGVVNGNKENECYFSDFGNKETLTFVYANVFSNKEYGEHWKHEFYDFELMFEGEDTSGIYYSFCYLTQSQANLIIDKETPTIEEYQNLIGNPVSITMDGVEYQWAIANIILETTNAVEVCNSLFGNFVLGYTKYPQDFNKQHCYIFNKYAYQNYYKLNYIISQFNPSEYVFYLGTNNYDGEFEMGSQNIDDMIFGKGISSTPLMAVLLSAAFVFLILSFYFCYIFNNLEKVKDLLITLVAIFIPYVIFKGLYLLFGNILLFSYQSLLFYLIFFVIFLVFFLVSKIWNKKRGVVKE
ncbi:MAG: hypothetical protein PHT30_00175 [Bacilli bacterium]|nr:hypothetical protein [Bacilli bacterium]